MNQISRETHFVAKVLNPSLVSIKTSSSLEGLEERNLIETLKENKVAIKFEKEMGSAGISEDEIFARFPLMRVFYDELHSRMEKDTEEFNRIARRFVQKGIRFILIKSDGSFPYESNNLDMLVRRGDLREAISQLEKAGYREIVVVREPHKFLFRRTGTSLAVHLHTRVEWEGTQFVDAERLWESARTPSDSNLFLVPSPENFVLITTAHFFFENHEIRMEDLDKIASCLRKHTVNWNLALDEAKKQRWDTAFLLALLLWDRIYRRLYGQTMLENEILSRIGESGSWPKLFARSMQPFNSHALIPLEIPYAISACYFVRRVLYDPGLSLASKAKHLNSVASSVLRRIARQL